jgi:hypothetical protein
MMKFLIDIAVIHTLFYVLWNFAVGLPIGGISALLGLETWTTRLFKSVGSFVLGSLSSIIVLIHYEGASSFILYSIIGGWFLLVILIAGTTDAKKKASEWRNSLEQMEMEWELEYDFIYWIIAIIFFILALFIPDIAANPINELFFYIKDWIMEIKILNWIVIGISFLLAISFLWHGIIGLWLIISAIRNKEE